MNARAVKRLMVGLPNDVLVLASATAQLEGIELHNRVIALNRAGGIAVSMPRTTGSGLLLQFVVLTVSTSTGYIFNCDPTTDGFFGSLGVNLTGSTATYFSSGTVASSCNVITLNGTTTGGVQIGDTFFVRDVAVGQWSVWGSLIGSGSVATPFS